MLFQILAGSGSQAKKRKRLLAVWVEVSRLVIPYPVWDRSLTRLGQRQVKLYTLFRTARPRNHTLSSGTSPYSPNKGVPPAGVAATTAKHPDSRSQISRYGWMQPTYMRSGLFLGKFTSGSRISASRSDLLKLPSICSTCTCSTCSICSSCSTCSSCSICSSCSTCSTCSICSSCSSCSSCSTCSTCSNCSSCSNYSNPTIATTGTILIGILFIFCPRAEYSYFSADFRLKILLWICLDHIVWHFCFRLCLVTEWESAKACYNAHFFLADVVNIRTY